MESCDLCMSARFGGIGHVQLFITLEDFCYGGKGLTGEGEIVLVDLVAITRFQPFVQTQPRNPDETDGTIRLIIDQVQVVL